MTAALIAELCKYRTPIVYDAIERFGVRPKAEGYSDSTIRAVLPKLGAFAGYACTGRIMAATEPSPTSATVAWHGVWAYVERSPGPKLMVCQDVDHPPRGCAWGDVSAAIFLRLGCSAVVTNGAVRDIREVEALGFGLFAGSPIVGHANVRFIEIGAPVIVGGLQVAPGDLLLADEHGVVVIPETVPLDALLAMIGRLVRSEAAVIGYTTSTDFSLEGLAERMEKLNEAGGHHLG